MRSVLVSGWDEPESIDVTQHRVTTTTRCQADRADSVAGCDCWSIPATWLLQDDEPHCSLLTAPRRYATIYSGVWSVLALTDTFYWVAAGCVVDYKNRRLQKSPFYFD